MMYLDLSEVDEVLQQSRLWSSGAFSLARFRRADYFAFVAEKSETGHAGIVEETRSAESLESCSTELQISHTQSRKKPASESTDHGLPDRGLPEIDESVRAAVENKLNFRPAGAIRVLTNFRYFGYLINPITCYYCFDESGERLQALLIEVTNTPWEQRTHYVLDLRQYQSGQSIDFNKDMHVSPFMPMNMMYRWKGSVPGANLMYSLASFMVPEPAWELEPVSETEIQSKHGESQLVSVVGETTHSRQFDSGVNFKRIEITSASLNQVLWQYPWMSGKVALAIYWQALRLWLKRIPFVPHPNKQSNVGK